VFFLFFPFQVSTVAFKGRMHAAQGI
jgi:hypothetical protein